MQNIAMSISYSITHAQFKKENACKTNLSNTKSTFSLVEINPVASDRSK